ncbi:methionine synthase [Thermodesulfobacteriota bacterium]
MNNKTNAGFNFKATGIGSVPTTDIKGTCLNILKQLPEIPFWPQFVKRSHLEDMSIQFSEGLPLLEVEEDRKLLVISSDDMESELVKFYDHFLTDDIDYFAINREYAPGLYEQINLLRHCPEKYGDYIKGHSVGPVTFSAGIRGADGKSVLSNPDLLEAFTKGLAIKALWQVRELGKSGKKPIIFLDEPCLAGFGSAFSPIERREVINLLREVIDYLRERSDTLTGIHCCGNTDWSMIIEAGPDIINFDAYAFMDYFLLYPDDIIRFFSGGGAIAWGIVPTDDFKGDVTVESLYARIEKGLIRLNEYGLDPEMVAENSILTPACGMGAMEQVSSDRVLELLSMLSKRMQ